MNHEGPGMIVADPYENDHGTHISSSSNIKPRPVAADESGLPVRLNVGVSTASTEIFSNFSSLGEFLVNEVQEFGRLLLMLREIFL
jgi:hypothetical protein